MKEREELEKEVEMDVKDEKEQVSNQAKPNALALIPFIVFVAVYLGSGIILDMSGMEMAFYQFPAPLAAAIGAITAFFVIKGNFEEKFETFVAGCGDSNIIIMCIIYLLAGGFAATCKAMGGIDSTVNLGLTYIPPEYLAAGVFVISGFIATATGTSVGSAAAVGPIAVAVAEKAGIPLPLMIGCVMGGIMLGDNLSIISDTTIASTRTQGCAMKDKFRLNFWLTLIPAILTVILLIIFGGSETAVSTGDHPYNLIKVLPYVVVLVTAVAGANVFLVLAGGIVLAGIIGLFYGDLTALTFAQAIYKGFLGMTDIFFLSMLTGGLAAMVNKAGGISYLLVNVQRFIKGKNSAELGISALVSITDIATANNTVSIIINGEVAKRICYKFHVDPRRSAALLSTFSSIFQGLIPYGAQMLIMVGFANGRVSPLEVLPYCWFIYLLGVSAIVSVFVPFSDGFIRKDPWNFAEQKPQSQVGSGAEKSTNSITA
ncbi:Na+/H+ antiporter NhaC family protein [uncultured Megasphaera sp.]|uniref:Na+/H+ antiporter NhaC family protein n=1 Tax=uncultured Megasphaera sp. TaxID=165188 RepID=UPI00260DF624|nr:Na+/H+ antiporter NhaC family protein [uncultured Megasphaera sp.]